MNPIAANQGQSFEKASILIFLKKQIIKKEEKNPAEMLNDLIKETGTGFFKGFENFFDDVASGAENLFKNSDRNKEKKDK